MLFDPLLLRLVLREKITRHPKFIEEKGKKGRGEMLKLGQQTQLGGKHMRKILLATENGLLRGDIDKYCFRPDFVYCPNFSNSPVPFLSIFEFLSLNERGTQRSILTQS